MAREENFDYTSAWEFSRNYKIYRRLENLYRKNAASLSNYEPEPAEESDNDYICDWARNCTVSSGEGDYKIVYAGPGDDIVCNCGSDSTLIIAGPGNDCIFSWASDNVIYGGSGNDEFYRYNTNCGYESFSMVHLYAGPGDNIICNCWSDSTLIIAGPGNDCIFSWASDNVIYGGPGNDAIYSEFYFQGEPQEKFYHYYQEPRRDKRKNYRQNYGKFHAKYHRRQYR